MGGMMKNSENLWYDSMLQQNVVGLTLRDESGVVDGESFVEPKPFAKTEPLRHPVL